MYLSTTSVIQGSANKVLRDSYLIMTMLSLIGAAIALYSAVLSLSVAGILAVLVGSIVLLWKTAQDQNSGWALATVLGFIGLAVIALSSLINLCLSPGNGPQVVTSALVVTGLIFFCKALFVQGTKARDITDLEQIVLIGIVVLTALFSTAYLFPLSSLALAMSVILIMLTSSPTMIAIQAIVRGGETNSVGASVGVFVALYKLVSKPGRAPGFLTET